MTFRRVLIALAILALFLGLAQNANSQKLTAKAQPATTKPSQSKAPSQTFTVELNGKKETMIWKTYTYKVDEVTYTTAVFYKPSTNEDWLHYESSDEIVGKEPDGRNRILHRATIRAVWKPLLGGEPRHELVEEYTGFSIDKSKEKFFKALEYRFKLVMPLDIEL